MRVSTAWLRYQVERQFNTTAEFAKIERANLGGGKWREDPTPVYMGEPCRIAPLNSRQIDIALRRGSEVTHACVFSPELSVLPGYQVTDAQGREFIVEIGPIEPSIPGVYKKVEMRQRTNEP
jgi:hypothetical protein